MATIGLFICKEINAHFSPSGGSDNRMLHLSRKRKESIKKVMSPEADDLANMQHCEFIKVL